MSRKQGNGSVPGPADVLSLRDRIASAALVMFVIAVQTWWLGRPVSVLSAGLLIAYGVWSAARWKNDAPTVLSVYLLAIAVHCLHFTEEYVTGFPRQFPKLMGGSDRSDARLVTFNMVWLVIFVLAGEGIYRRSQMAYLAVIFLALIGGAGNGTTHLLWSAIFRRYFPGAITAPLCLLVGIALLVRLAPRTRARA